MDTNCGFPALHYERIATSWIKVYGYGECWIPNKPVCSVPIVLFVFWRERPHWIALFAVLLASIGAYLLSTAGQFEVQTGGDVLELAGVLFWAVHVVLLGKFASRFESISFSVGQLLVCGLLNLGVGIFTHEPAYNWSLVGAVFYTAVFALGCATHFKFGRKNTHRQQMRRLS